MHRLYCGITALDLLHHAGKTDMASMQAAESLSPGFYNRIKHSDEQIRYLSDEILRQLGHIFLKHRMADYYYAEILHRHITLPTNYVMVYSTSRPGFNTCQARRFDSLPSELFPHSFLLDNDGRFRPFEYNLVPEPVTLHADFLHDLSNFMIAHELESSIAISRANGSDEMQLEYLLPSDQGTTCVPTSCHVTYPQDLTITAWKFIERQDKVAWVAKRGCSRLLGGEHEVKPD